MCLVIEMEGDATYLNELILEAGHYCLRCLTKLVNVDKVVFGQRVQESEDDVFGNFFPDARHRTGCVHQNNHVLGASGCLQVPRPQPAVEQIWFPFTLTPLGP